jgi:hypothetical protein
MSNTSYNQFYGSEIKEINKQAYGAQFSFRSEQSFANNC